VQIKATPDMFRFNVASATKVPNDGSADSMIAATCWVVGSAICRFAPTIARKHDVVARINSDDLIADGRAQNRADVVDAGLDRARRQAVG
jgi:hypothetical protein